MKQKKWSRKLIQATMGAALVVLTLYLAFNSYIGVTYAIDLNAGQSGITIDQTDLFNLSNMYPGQSPLESKQPLKVINSGSSDFQCTITSVLSDGDQRLFDILKLNILDNNGEEIYSGSLGNLEELTLATIRPGASKNFDFTLELPADVDNSYQGLSTAFQFNIAASGGSGGGGSGGGGSGGGGSGSGSSSGGSSGESGESENNEENPPEDEPEVVPVSEPSEPIPQEPPQSIPDPVVDSPMPNTGIPSHLPYYSVGLAAISVGLYLGLKKK